MAHVDLDCVLDALIAEIDQSIRANPGRLCVLKVQAPSPSCAQVRDELPERLVAMGLDFVEVEVVATTEAASVLETHFDAGWA